MSHNKSANYTVKMARCKEGNTRMWADAQRDGRPAEHRWRTPLNATKFG